jgi:hypothetical protein
MFCSHCGKELIEEAPFCPYCGALGEQPAPAKTGNEEKAVASLWCGIVPFLPPLLAFLLPGILVPHTLLLPIVLLAPVVGLVLGIIGLKSQKSGIATIGICLNVTALVVIVALVFFAFQNLHGRIKMYQCIDTISDMGLSLHAYHDKHGALPPLYTVDEEGKPLHSWRVLILPFIVRMGDASELYEKIRLDEPWDSEYNRQFHDQMPDFYQCPLNPKKGCCYTAIAGGSFVPAKEPGSVLGLSYDDFAEGKSSNTLTITEVKEPFCWMDPTADVSLEDFVQQKRVGNYNGGMMAAVLNAKEKFRNTGVAGTGYDDSRRATPEDLRRMAMP